MLSLGSLGADGLSYELADYAKVRCRVGPFQICFHLEAKFRPRRSI